MTDIVYGNITCLRDYAGHDHTVTAAQQALYNTLTGVFKYFLKEGVEAYAAEILTQIQWLLAQFTLHNTIDDMHKERKGVIKAYSCGSTASIYLVDGENGERTIVKQYNTRFRWSHPGHNHVDSVFNKEADMIGRLGYSCDIDRSRHIIRMPYFGVSLYELLCTSSQRLGISRVLPTDWSNQLRTRFSELDEKGIYYPEFNLHNMVVHEGRLSFVDYGLAEVRPAENAEGGGVNGVNNENANQFGALLTGLLACLDGCSDPLQRRLMYIKSMENGRDSGHSNVF